MRVRNSPTIRNGEYVLNITADSKLDPISLMVNRVKSDQRRHVLDLSIGFYQSEDQRHTGFSVLDDSKADSACNDITFSILGIEKYRDAVKKLITPKDTISHNISTVQTIGASGGLWLVFLILKREAGAKRVWFSDPTWGNHLEIAKSIGLGIERYNYDINKDGTLNFSAIKESLNSLKPNDILVLQGCCHNPCGVDLTLEQWTEVSILAKIRSVYIVIDFAYFGLLRSFVEDKAILTPLLDILDNLFVVNSFSKSLGLYGERLGSLTFFSRSELEVSSFENIAKNIVRSTYSMPPQQWATQVADVITSPDAFRKWVGEIAVVRDTLNSRKEALISALVSRGIDGLITNTKSNGMFLNLALSAEEVEALAVKFGVYILGNGRLSLAGLQKRDINKLADAIYEIKL